MSDSLLTPNRHTRVEYDIPVPALDRPAHIGRRVGSQISRARTERVTSARTTLQPGNGWTLSMIGGDAANFLSTVASADVLGSDEFNKATGIAAINSYVSPGAGGAGLRDMGASSSLISAGVPVFTKRIAAGATWSNKLTADTTAYPQPTLSSALLPMDRTLSGKTTWPANSAFVIAFTVPEGIVSNDVILSFYFGGPNVNYPAGAKGGAFCVTLFGNGKAELREFTNATPDPWALRKEFAWRLNTGGGNISHHWLKIVPYGRDTIAFSTLDMDAVISDPGFSAGGLVAGLIGHMIGAQNSKTGTNFYRNHAGLTGYVGKSAITGPGTVRLDVRRDLRGLFMVGRLRPLASGTLVDLPFDLPYPLAGGESITIAGNTFLPAGTSVTVALHSAATDVACTPLGNNRFEAFAGTQQYYPVFTFNADDDRTQTPVLWDYSYSTLGSVQDRSPVPSTGGNIRKVSISGPDLTPDQETASVEIKDPMNVLETPLRTRGRIPARIAVYNDLGALTSVIFQGEAAQAVAKKRGKTGMVYPSAAWRDYDITLVGQWARLEEFLNLSHLDYNTDLDGPIGADGQRPAWKITSIVRDLLLRCGFPSDMLDIPNLGLRFQPVTAAAARDVILQAGTSFGEVLNKLCRDFLGLTLAFDPNAGTRGMWRLLGFPQAPYTPLANFIGAPLGSNQLGVHPNSYPASYCPILGDSFRSFVRAPEANYVYVAGMEPVIPSKVYACMYNPVSFDLTGATSDASHPDYLGRFVPVIYVDPMITSTPTAAVVCKRIYDRACHAEKVLKWQSPLLFITNPADAYQARVRPLRIFDPVTVHGAAAVIRSVNPTYDHDGVMVADYEAIAV